MITICVSIEDKPKYFIMSISKELMNDIAPSWELRELLNADIIQSIFSDFLSGEGSIVVKRTRHVYEVQSNGYIPKSAEILKDKDTVEFRLKKSKTESGLIRRCLYNDDYKNATSYNDGEVVVQYILDGNEIANIIADGHPAKGKIFYINISSEMEPLTQEIEESKILAEEILLENLNV